MAADLDLSDAGRSADSTVARAFTPSMVEAGSMVAPAFAAAVGSTAEVAAASMVADAGRGNLQKRSSDGRQRTLPAVLFCTEDFQPSGWRATKRDSSL